MPRPSHLDFTNATSTATNHAYLGVTSRAFESQASAALVTQLPVAHGGCMSAKMTWERTFITAVIILGVRTTAVGIVRENPISAFIHFANV